MSSRGRLARGICFSRQNSAPCRFPAAAGHRAKNGRPLPCVDQLLVRLESEPEHRAWLLWILGVLGNRGVETSRLELTFLDRIHDPDQTTRNYVAIGLGLLATDSAIPHLIGMFREDPSPV